MFLNETYLLSLGLNSFKLRKLFRLTQNYYDIENLLK